MVCGSATQNRLGPRMDRPRPTAHRPPIGRRGESPIPPPTSNSATRHSRATNQEPPPKVGQRPPPISRLSRCLRTTEGQRPPSIQTLGPRHRPKTRRPGNSHQQSAKPSASPEPSKENSPNFSKNTPLAAPSNHRKALTPHPSSSSKRKMESSDPSKITAQ